MADPDLKGWGWLLTLPACLPSAIFFTQNTEAGSLGPSATFPTVESANLVTDNGLRNSYACLRVSALKRA